ncbi:MAG: phosphoribosylamine--glycine ligase [Gammaproteobacteria bacterium]
MKVLIVGSGGREHALAWKCAQASRVTEVLVAPGNAGTATEPKVRNVEVMADDIQGLVQLAQEEAVDLTIIGPEGPLVAGIVDVFKQRGLKCFGPGRKPAQLEGSKSFTKAFLARHGIPTAVSVTFTRENFDAQYIQKQRMPIVVKASGLAAGKGVVICETAADAIATTRAMFDGQFGEAGTEVVIEDFLEGEEASFIVMADGKNILAFASSQDHKRRDDGDHGPNTGGMGAYSPAPVVTPAMHARIMKQVIEPTIRGLEKDGMPYTGFLYAGIMVAPDGTPNVLEFNCRLGDPETQPILMRLESDLTELCEAALEGRLDKVKAKWDARAALGVVLAAGGYPDTVRTGDVIEGLADAAKSPGKVFHAGTVLNENGEVVTNGGRVLCAVGLGTNVREAKSEAYALADSIHWSGLQYRRDIGYRAVERERAAVRGK